MLARHRRILLPLVRRGSPGPWGNRYCPVKTNAISESPSTTNTCDRAEKETGDMPLSPRVCGVDDNLSNNDHIKVEARSQGRSCLLPISARRHCIIDPGLFLMGGPPAARKRNIGMMTLQDWFPSTVSLILHSIIPEASLYVDKIFAQQISSNVSSDPNEWSESRAMVKPRKTTNDEKNDHVEGATRSLFWE